MVTIGMNYRVLEDKQDAFIKMFDKVLEIMGQDPGHRQSNLYRDVHDPCSFLIVSDWADRGAFDAFIRSETFAKVANWGKEKILAGRPSHRVYVQDEPMSA
jgi:quinol monooxygenase YgiN